MKSGGGFLSFLDFLDFGDKLGLGKLGMANDIGDVFKGKPMLDPILNGVITPTGQFSKKSNEWLDKKGLGDVGWFHNNIAPLIAASVFTGGAAAGAGAGGAAGGAGGSAGGSGLFGGLFSGGSGVAGSGAANTANTLGMLGIDTGAAAGSSGGLGPGLFSQFGSFFGAPSTAQKLMPLANYGQGLMGGQGQPQGQPMMPLQYSDVRPQMAYGAPPPRPPRRLY